MYVFLSIFFWVGLIAGMLALLAFLLRRFLFCPPQPDAIHYLESADGWRIGLGRYEPRAPLPGAAPVVLCPGVGFSASIFDLPEELSLARYLAAQGYDVWTLDFRGRGFSDKPRLWGNIRFNWSFDDYVDFDVPAAVDRICQLTGAAEVQWIGFDMGALALWAAAGGQKVRHIKSAIALGAACFFKRQRPHLSTNLLRLLSLLRLEAVAALLSPLWGHLYPPPLNILQNRDNIDGTVYRRALVNSSCSFSRKEMAQYRLWLEEDCFQSSDGQRDFRAGLNAVKIPTLFICGVRDVLGPVDMVEATSVAMSAVEQKETLLASRMHSMSANYGHLDLLIGRNAHRDIFPHLLQWLDLHAGIHLQGRPEAPAERVSAQESRRSSRDSALAPFPAPDSAAEALPLPGSAGSLKEPDLDAEAPDESWIPPSSAELLARAATGSSMEQDEQQSHRGDQNRRGQKKSESSATEDKFASHPVNRDQVREQTRDHSRERARSAEDATTKEIEQDLEEDDDLDGPDGDVPHLPTSGRD